MPNERARKVNPRDLPEGELEGPLTLGYPHALLNTDTAAAGERGQLEQYELTLHSGERTLLMYGDYLVHLHEDSKAGWSVSQYLGYNDWHNTEAHPGELCLRRLGRYRGTPPRGPWYYLWAAEHGEPERLATDKTLGHDEEPSVRNAGELSTLWDYIPAKDVVGVVTLTSSKQISQRSWSSVLHATYQRKLSPDMLMH